MEAFNVFWIAALVIVLALDAWLIYSVWRSTKSSGTKVGWTVLILALPIVGAGIWGVAGPRGVVEAPTSNEHSKG
ncbi:PLD nuclease N-terminal domain-containing protein [Pseudomonas alliivorans]|uniref:PLDc_N domain-containing protein n=1 Tax=Pseudomonas alliivorans TaxID=2810613 RepID=A0ABS4CA01_9PSED|nr:PLD nuclease N-terminal domain-containing protein [Pseudomonas alliivorans]MBP0947469.1 PLDc_N domain-containing protein [Pseudomonas alliivorans]MEE4326893.1 PLD nuclease N-terminal domain-containing protein [Pseudomonas alliivorans]MEE4335444.1 PLD nuclease N-terminal domain-containing protein [Pseudomonas alliivorans]MEE4368423.1 PLD nuclease N-terminal domain-containing protein [Pseudomonas alliivorans]MEE4571970.1 PLD nuclease N-terminal domain-containing protein [Pseudomonas alliivora